MNAPDTVRIPRITTPTTRFWTFVVFALLLGAGASVWFRQPEHRVGVLIGIPTACIALVLIIASSTWIEPTDGNLLIRRWGWFESRHAFRPGSRFRLTRVVTGSLVLQVWSESGLRTGGHVTLLQDGNADDWASIGPEHLVLIADVLDRHCPAAAPEIAAVLRAQAEHVAADRPLSSSPLAPYLTR